MTAARLAPVSLGLAIAAAVVALVATPVELALQLTAASATVAARLGFGIPTLLLAVAALIVGVIALRRADPRRAIAAAGAALGGFLALGQLVGVLAFGIAAIAAAANGAG